MSEQLSRPALRYHGGKWTIAPWIISFFAPHQTYVEVYGGGCSVLLRKPASHLEIYNELDEDVVNFFQVLRDPALAQELERAVVLTPFARGEFEAAKPYLGDGPLERARKLVVRSYMGFSGSEAQYRKASENGFRTPSYGAGTCIAKVWARWPEKIADLTARLRGVTIERLTALEALEKYDKPDTLFYVDPPYVHSTRNASAVDHAREMYAHEMSDEEHRELAVVLSRVQGFVILSGYDCPLYREIYGSWRRETHQSKTNKNQIKAESLWLNAAAAQATQGRLL